jgi:hypothetical protein
MNPTQSPPAGKDRWPWGKLEEANERYADAAQRELEAAVLDQQAAKDQATLDKRNAMGDRQLIRDELTGFELGSLRITIQEQPEQLRALLAEALGMTLVEISDALTELFKRLVKLEGRGQ